MARRGGRYALDTHGAVAAKTGEHPLGELARVAPAAGASEPALAIQIARVVWLAEGDDEVGNHRRLLTRWEPV